METIATTSLNQISFCSNTRRQFTSNFCNGSVSALGSSFPWLNSSNPNRRRSVFVTRASVAVELKQQQTKTAVIRIGTRGRYLYISFFFFF